MSRQPSSGYAGGKSGNDYYRGSYGSSRRGKPYDHHQHHHQGTTRYESSTNANYEYNKPAHYPQTYPTNYQYDTTQPQQPVVPPVPAQPPAHTYPGSQVGYDGKTYGPAYDQNQSNYAYPQEVPQQHFQAHEYPRYDGNRTATYDDKYNSTYNQPATYETQDSRYEYHHGSTVATYQEPREATVDSRYTEDSRYNDVHGLRLIPPVHL